jgi:uncharacterized membrane protein
MKTEDNKSLMMMAREALKGQWGLAVGGFLVYCLILGLVGAIPGAGQIISVFIVGPMMGGLAIFSLAISRKQEAKVEQLFQGFNNFGKFLGAYWLMILFVFLWSLLLIIPGIIAAFSYALIFFIIADDSSIGVSEALKKSKAMMKGYKWKYFCLSWRFFGWAILSVLSCGIGFLWLFPYMQISFAKFYEDLKAGQKFNTLDADV